MTANRRLSLLFAGAAILGAGCGDAGGAADPPVGSLHVDRASTTPFTPPTAPDEAALESVTALDAGAVDELCPERPVDVSANESTAMVAEASRLEPTLGVVLQYGQEHPAMFGGYGLHWWSSADASVFASFTQDIDEHRAALAELVPFPDELIVCQAAASESERLALDATLRRELDGRFTSLASGSTGGALSVTLNATEEALAGELVERYGAAVELTVGALKYPLDDASPVCGPTQSPSLVDSLAVSLVQPQDPAEVTAAGIITATLRLTNTGDEPLSFLSGLPTTTITDADGAPLSNDLRAVPLAAVSVELEPGAHQDFEVEISVASCNPAVGYTVPAGEHFVVATIWNGDLGSDMHSDPLPITILD